MQISGGSGYYHIDHSGQKMAQVTYDEKLMKIHVSIIVNTSLVNVLLISAIFHEIMRQYWKEIH